MQEHVHADVPKTIIREGGISQYLLYAKKRKNTEGITLSKALFFIILFHINPYKYISCL